MRAASLADAAARSAPGSARAGAGEAGSTGRSSQLLPHGHASWRALAGARARGRRVHARALSCGSRREGRASLTAAISFEAPLQPSVPEGEREGSRAEASAGEATAGGAAESRAPASDPPAPSPAKEEPYVLGWPRTLHECYEVGGEIGRGSFGVVKSASERWPVRRSSQGGRDGQCHGFNVDASRESFAVKSIPKIPLVRKRRGISIMKRDPAKAAQRQREKLLAEVGFMVSLSDCSCAAQLKGAYEDDTHAHLVIEQCAGGDLRTYLEAQGRLGEADAAQVMFAVLSFIEHCHRKGFVFCDVKPANFMLKREAAPGALEVKGIDFGCSQRVPEGGSLMKRTGTPAYWAPDVFMRHYDRSADLWSCGMMMYEMLVGLLPFWDRIQDCTPRDVQREVMYGSVRTDREPYQALSEEAKDLIARLLEYDPAARITAAEALDHPWMRKHEDGLHLLQ